MSDTHQSSRRIYGADELVISYDDACIYGRDLALLEQPTSWLNGSCIQFQMARLQTAHQQNLLPNNSSKRNFFMDPAVVSYLMHQCRDLDDLRDFARGYQPLAGIGIIVCPVNDFYADWSRNNIYDQEFPMKYNTASETGGTHWSLLAVVVHPPIAVESSQKSCHQFYHFDSVPGCNTLAAELVAAKWSKVLELIQQLDLEAVRKISDKSGYCTIDSHDKQSSDRVIVEDCSVPKQSNAFDCGVHVVAIAKIVAEQNNPNEIRQAGQILTTKVQNEPSYIQSVRLHIAKDIRSLASTQETFDDK